MNTSDKIDELIEKLRSINSSIKKEDDEEKIYYLELEFKKIYDLFDEKLKHLIENNKKE